MNTTTTFTSTFSPQLMAWVDTEAQKKKQTRRAVLEDAVKTYRHQLMSEKLRKDFERVAGDPEILKLAEMGVADYARVLGSM